MQGQQNHGRNHYRCRHRDDYAPSLSHPANVYLPERLVLPELDRWIAELFTPGNRPATCKLVAEAGRSTTGDDGAAEAARRAIRTSERKLESYRNLLEEGADPRLVASWINEVTAAKAQAERRLRDQQRRKNQLPEEEVAEVVERLGGICDLLARASPEARASLYRALGVVLRYDGRQRVVHGTTDATQWWGYERVGGGT